MGVCENWARTSLQGLEATVTLIRRETGAFGVGEEAGIL